jgi:hypothetical protein
MTQRPDLFKVALPAVGVMDMLRFHKFTVGWGWVTEYGSADSASQFPYLFKYSPYHNLNPGTKYPATLVTTADHDDRVVPAHSFKFAARLQEYNKSDNPVLIRIDTDAGHGAGKPTSKAIDEAADTWSFVMHNLGMPFVEPAPVTDAGSNTKAAGSNTTLSEKEQRAAASQPASPETPSAKSTGPKPSASGAANPKGNPFIEKERAKKNNKKTTGDNGQKKE